MYNVLICDDDEIILKTLKKDIIRCFGERISEIVVFNSREKLEFYLEENLGETNIVFMDIELKEDSGIQIADSILKKQPSSQIIFVSGYDNYYLDVYNVEHAYFLRKPVDKGELLKALERAAQHLDDTEKKCLVIRNKNGVHRVPYNEILYFENDKRRIHIHTLRGLISFYGRFEDLLAELDDRFVKCHKSYISNIARAKGLIDRKFVYETGDEAPISKMYYEEAKEAFFCFLDGENDSYDDMN